MKKSTLLKYITRYVILLLAALLLISSSVFLSSCAREPVFGSLTICEKINEETKEPVITKNEFEFDVKEIYSTIKVENIKGDDNYRFLWKNTESGAIINDITSKYQEGQKGLLTGWSSGLLRIAEDAIRIADPGKYTVEFYHNGELKASAEFTIKDPVAKIIQVSLANEISIESEPLNTTQEFSQEDVVYACVQLDYLVPDDSLTAKWFDDKGAIIVETPIIFSEYYFFPSWVAFSFESTDSNPLPAGNYNVEIHFNNNFYGAYPFEILSPQHQSGAVSFSNNNIFAEAEAKYGFKIMYPDNWNYSWQEDNTGMNVTFTPPNVDEEAGSTAMFVINEGYPENAEDARIFMDEVAAASTEGMEQVGEPVIAEKKMLSGIGYTEYIYNFSSPELGQFGLIMSTFVLNNKMYIWFGFAHETFYNALNTAYYEAFNSLSFTE
ncbi:MAG: hypothetical protein FJW61_05910 [Actinobacteria bacterium]|nr:hypothetical protein [Actinomycetota bacterium]